MIGDVKPKSQEAKRLDAKETGGGGVGEDIGNNSERFNDYTNNTQTATDEYLHIEGKNNKSTGYSYCTYIGGEGNRVYYAKWCVIHGNGNKITQYGYYDIISGDGNTIVSGSSNNVIGASNSLTSSNKNVVCGEHNTLNGADDDIVGGEYNTVTGDYDIVAGYHNTVSTNYSGVFGQFITIGGSWNLAVGLNITVSYATYSIIAGRDHNISNASEALICGSYANVSSSDRIVIGAGSSNNPANCFRVDYSGNVYATQYNTSGADYAEYFEWADGNTNGEDRRGMLVQLTTPKWDDKSLCYVSAGTIEPANGDDILGAVSCRASVIGNAYEEHWHGKYKTDVFGAYIPDKDGKSFRWCCSH